MMFVIMPPGGYIWKECPKCKMPFAADENWEICIMCELLKEGEDLGLYE